MTGTQFKKKELVLKSDFQFMIEIGNNGANKKSAQINPAVRNLHLFTTRTRNSTEDCSQQNNHNFIQQSGQQSSHFTS
jgi:hypothetical protein